MRLPSLPTKQVQRNFLAALGSVALVATATPAAAELDQSKLQADLQGIVDSYVAGAEGMLVPAGPVTSSMDGDEVVLTVPALQFKTDEAEFNVPPVVIRLDDAGADRIGYKVMLPSEIVGMKTGPRPNTLTVKFGGQDISGVYRPSVKVFERYLLRLENMSLSADDGALELGSVVFDVTSDETAPSDWVGVANFAMTGVRVVGPNQQQIVSIGDFAANTSFDKFDLPAYTELSERISGGNPMFGMPKVDEAAAKAAMAELVRRLPEMIDGASGVFDMQMRGLDVAAVNSPAFKLETVLLKLGMAPDDAHYGLNLNLAVEEPTVDPAGSPVPPNLVPKRLVAEAGLRKLPVQTVWQMVAEPLERTVSGEMTPEEEKAAEDMMEMLPFAAMGMAAEAGSFGEINSIVFEVGPARLTAAGVAPLTPGMPEPPLRIQAQIAGLDALVEEVQALPPQMRDQAMPVLVALKGLGKAESVNGGIVYAYLVEQGEKGDIVVNGVGLEDLGK